MLEIPLTANINQQFTVVLGGQLCIIRLYENAEGLFMDLNANGKTIQTGVICQNDNPMFTATYLGFYGRLKWLDTQGTSDPVLSGIGARYKLYWLKPGIDY